MPLFKGLCEEYKIDFDLKLCSYYRGLIMRCGEEIYDLNCLDANMPPVFPQYRDVQFLQSSM
jgi:hypothetical protein